MNLDSLVVHSAGYGAAVGSVLPILAAIVLRPHWSPKAKQMIVGVLAGISGAATVAAQGGFSDPVRPGALLTAIVAVFAASEVSYAALWHRSGIAPKIEIATSPVPPARVDLSNLTFDTSDETLDKLKKRLREPVNGSDS
ncbi:hypothetical protein [Streptomyces sp. MJM8645]|uniref:hypothetical protein n=1 Tax=Streptomycetaceae TaxID=2062 RepID=UPI0007AF5C05|nr:hypothetical protein [Streptomyces sp. MJM8645]